MSIETILQGLAQGDYGRDKHNINVTVPAWLYDKLREEAYYRRLPMAEIIRVTLAARYNDQETNNKED